jgi:hypothetical protein
VAAGQNAPAHVAGSAAHLGRNRATQRQGQPKGGAALAHALGPVEQQGMGQTIGLNRAQKQRGGSILTD